MLNKKINVELMVVADEADAVVAELNAALDRLEERHTVFGGGIETVAFEQAACLGDRSRAVGYTEVRMHPLVEIRSDPIGRWLDAFIAEIDFGLPPMMRHMNVQG